MQWVDSQIPNNRGDTYNAILINYMTELKKIVSEIVRYGRLKWFWHVERNQMIIGLNSAQKSN